jgi:large subunit ribosomal protein L21
MYAVIQSGSKQYRVSEGDVIRVEKLPLEAGQQLEFEQVLLISDGENLQVGRPTVAGAKVTATVKNHGRGKKIIVYKHKKNYHKKQGHRQDFTAVQIGPITSAGASQEK